MSKDNVILGLHPLTKIWIIPIIMLVVMLFSNSIINLILMITIILIAYISGCGKEFMSLWSKTLLILASTMFLMQSLFFPDGREIWSWWIFSMTEGAVAHALNMSSTILTTASSFLLYFRLTTERDFVSALEDVGLNNKACFIILATLQMIPQMKQQSTTIMDAQKTRGIEVEGTIKNRMKAFIPSLGPLVLASIAATEERAITLEARGFSVECKKTKLNKLHKKPIDKILNVIFIGLIIGMIILKVVL